jgi:hypothetical protein
MSSEPDQRGGGLKGAGAAIPGDGIAQPIEQGRDLVDDGGGDDGLGWVGRRRACVAERAGGSVAACVRAPAVTDLA